MRKMPFVQPLLAVAAALALTACDKKAPTAPPRTEPVVLAAALEIQGPGEVAPQATTQFRALARFADGSTRDVTDEAHWSTLTHQLVVVARGLVTTNAGVGDATIGASYGGQAVTAQLIILPAGTFKLTGMVTEAGSEGFRLSGARIEAQSAAGLLTTTTATSGEYKMYGVAGATEIRVVKDGYQTLVRTIQVGAHDRVDLQVAPTVARGNIAGAYTLTVTAADACRGELPVEAHERRYGAVVSQNGPSVSVVLDGTFANAPGGRRDRFWGTLEPSRVSFALSDFFDDPSCSLAHECFSLADVIEEIAPATYFSPTGNVTSAIGASSLSGTLSGTISVRGPEASRFPVTASCKSDAHRFEFRRR